MNNKKPLNVENKFQIDMKAISGHAKLFLLRCINHAALYLVRRCSFAFFARGPEVSYRGMDCNK